LIPRLRKSTAFDTNSRMASLPALFPGDTTSMAQTTSPR
jgi:hypothetical protein